MPNQENILVIKHGALGDFILATGPFAAIKNQHKSANIVLITNSLYKDMDVRSGYFNEVWTDNRPKFWQFSEIYQVLRMLRRPFHQVYDLQTSQRTAIYYKLMKPVSWCGVVPGCSHFYDRPDRKSIHVINRQKEMLAVAGITEVPDSDLSWLRSDLSKFDLKDKYALIVPGGSAKHPGKRWTSEGFAAVAAHLESNGVTPVLIGTKLEQANIEAVINLSKSQSIVNLLGRTSFADLAELARGAVLAIGNDTGPMHLIAAAKCPSIILFSGLGDPKISAPLGEHVRTLQKDNLQDLLAEDVLSTDIFKRAA